MPLQVWDTFYRQALANEMGHSISMLSVMHPKDARKTQKQLLDQRDRLTGRKGRENILRDRKKAIQYMESFGVKIIKRDDTPEAPQ